MTITEPYIAPCIRRYIYEDLSKEQYVKEQYFTLRQLETGEADRSWETVEHFKKVWKKHLARLKYQQLLNAKANLQKSRP